MPESPKNRVRGSILGPTSPGRLRVVLVQSLLVCGAHRVS